MRDFIVVGFIWASGRCQILDSEILRDCPGDLVFPVIGTLDHTIRGRIVGSAISTRALSLFLVFLFSVVDMSLVVGTMIYIALIRFSARVQEVSEVMKRLPS
jgi:hypothetical protein